MDGKKNSARCWLFCLFTILLPTVSSQLAVSIQPENPAYQNVLYTNEKADFKIVAINLTNERMVGEKFKVLASPELVLLEKNREVKEQSFVIPELLANQAVELRFSAQALSVPAEKAVLSANFGQTVFSGLSAINLRIVKSPLKVTAVPQKKVLNQGEASKLFVSIENDSNQTLGGINADLVSSNSMDSLSKPFQLLSMEPGQKQENLSFEFWPRPLSLGSQELELMVSFSDSAGLHYLGYTVPIEVQDKASTVLFWVFVVIIILALYWVWLHVVSKPPMKLHAGVKTEEKK